MRLHGKWSTPDAVGWKPVRARVPNIEGGATFPPPSTSLSQRHQADQPLSAASATGAAPWHSLRDRAKMQPTGASLTRCSEDSLTQSRSSDAALGAPPSASPPTALGPLESNAYPLASPEQYVDAQVPQRGTLSGSCKVSPTTGTCPCRSTGCRTCLPPLDTTTGHLPGTRSETRRVRCRPCGVVHRRGRSFEERGATAPPRCQKQGDGISHPLS